jgi:hypothetical protein
MPRAGDLGELLLARGQGFRQLIFVRDFTRELRFQVLTLVIESPQDGIVRRFFGILCQLGFSFVAKVVDLGDERLDLDLGGGELVCSLLCRVAESFFPLFSYASLLNYNTNG